MMLNSAAAQKTIISVEYAISKLITFTQDITWGFQSLMRDIRKAMKYPTKYLKRLNHGYYDDVVAENSTFKRLRRSEFRPKLMLYIAACIKMMNYKSGKIGYPILGGFHYYTNSEIAAAAGLTKQDADNCFRAFCRAGYIITKQKYIELENGEKRARPWPKKIAHLFYSDIKAKISRIQRTMDFFAKYEDTKQTAKITSEDSKANMTFLKDMMQEQEQQKSTPPIIIRRTESISQTALRAISKERPVNRDPEKDPDVIKRREIARISLKMIQDGVPEDERRSIIAKMFP